MADEQAQQAPPKVEYYDIRLRGFNDPDFIELMKDCDEVLRTKGNDYTQGNDGAYGTLKSFFVSAEDIDLPPYKVLYVLLAKHLAAIKSFIKRGQVESEPIEQRIVDAVNYLFLLYKMIKVLRRQKDGQRMLSQTQK